MSEVRRSLAREVSSCALACNPIPGENGDIDPEGILARRLRLFEVTEGSVRSGAVLAEVADVLTGKVLEGAWTAEETEPLIDWAAEAGDVETEDARLGIFLDAVNNPRLLALPP